MPERKTMVERPNWKMELTRNLPPSLERLAAVLGALAVLLALWLK